ncbi:MAG: hypothetical protein FJZ60_00025 [Chlamydiae bacterium]|nr:hypothetical protein [Chlamydiota bacterium]
MPNNNLEKCVWTQTLPVGALVRPIKRIFLTPLQDEENSEWVQWNCNELAIVLPRTTEHLGVLVLAPGGVGFCFADEVKQIKS